MDFMCKAVWDKYQHQDGNPQHRAYYMGIISNVCRAHQWQLVGRRACDESEAGQREITGFNWPSCYRDDQNSADVTTGTISNSQQNSRRVGLIKACLMGTPRAEPKRPKFLSRGAYECRARFMGRR